MMKKIFPIFILGLAAFNAQADMKPIQSQLKQVSSLTYDADKFLNETTSTFSQHVNWPGKEDAQQALLIINWDGIPAEELNDLRVRINNPGALSMEHKFQGLVQTWIYVPLNTKKVTLTHPRLGTTDISLPELKQHDVWQIPVMIDQLVNVQINPLTDYNKPVRVTLVNLETGDERIKSSPATFENVSPGTYEVQFAIDGRNEVRTINVTPTQKVFGGKDFDFRHSKRIKIESTQPGRFFIDEAYAGAGEDLSVTLPYGPHTVKIQVDNELSDQKTIDVNALSEDIFYLSPIQSMSFEVVGMYQGKAVPTRISVPGLPDYMYNADYYGNEHKFNLPVTSPAYTYNLYYDGHKGSKEIKVTPKMNNVQEIKISAERKIVWPWQREYENVNNWWEFSYVAKQYKTSGHLYENGSDIKTTIKENGVWDSGYDRWLHGFRMGWHYQPAFKFGLGLYTGLFSEFYFSSTSAAPIDIYDKYFEWDLSLPIHILYQVPLGSKFCVGFHTGPSFNLAVLGTYYDKFMPNDDDTDNVKDWSSFWSEPWAPSRFNVDWDFSLFIRWRKIMISGTLSNGLTNNKMHQDFGADAKTVMNKAVIAISFGL